MTNEEVSKESIRFAYNASRVTINGILRALKKAYMMYKRGKYKAGKGQQTVKQLIKQGQGATSMEVSGESMRQFKRIANKYGVDFAIVKDKTAEKPRYTVFFKAKDADAIGAVLNEYTGKIVKKNKEQERPSVLQKLRTLKAEIAKLPHKKVHNRKKEQVR